jgi:hypothetical protein
MTASRDGQVVTFYSYKGGAGRTMALANLAWILAANGKRVLLADWDLESPGLHRFFKPFIDPAVFAHTGGVIDLVREFELAARRAEKRGLKRDDQWYSQFARVQKYAFSLNWTFPGGGTLDFLSAGRQNNEYAASLAGMDWDIFYRGLGGGPFLDALRADMKRRYDYTLIDSRTGVSDVASVCTVHLPDVLVTCFTLSDQSIDGAARVAREVQGQYGVRNIRILPVPMRIDRAGQAKVDLGFGLAMQEFAGLPADLLDAERAEYWASVPVPYEAYYSYEEVLATFGDAPGGAMTLLSAYERLARYVTGGEVTKLPAIEDAMRERIRDQFERKATKLEREIRLDHVAEDQLWADWIGHVLTSAGVTVADAATARRLVIISPHNPAPQADDGEAAGQRPALGVYVTERRAVPAFPPSRSAFLAGRSGDVAAERILKLIGYAGVDVDLSDAVRYPGKGPAVSNLPLRNARFTGREEDLRRMRELLQARDPAAALPVVLQGMSGVGKTHLAIEYAHRFGAAYDVVWWIDADPVTFVDVKLGDLGTALGVPAQTSVPETTRSVLQALGDGQPYRRWLVIFDNADAVEEMAQFLPRGPGHVLITSRDRYWDNRGTVVAVSVFKREESIALLGRRVPAMTTAEANAVADRLGDLPIAVAVAGDWMSGTGITVDDYLREIDRGPDAAVDATFDLSLACLRERSPAAYRMLQLCSVMAPEISLDLIYSDEFAKALVTLDPALTERVARGRLVQLLNRLSLLRVDHRATGRPDEWEPGAVPPPHVRVHRLLQEVVRTRMTEPEREEVRHQVHQVLAASRPRAGDVDDPDTWPGFRRLWPHLERSEPMACDDEGVRRLLIERVRYLWITGGLAYGRELAERIDAVWTGQLEAVGPDDTDRHNLRPQLLNLRFNLANLLRDQADFQASRALDEATLDEQRNLLGPQHPHTLMTAGGLAADLRALGQYEDARRQDEQTYAAWALHFGDDHPRTMTALSNLAASYRLAGDYRAALDRDENVYQRRRLILGAAHPNTLLSASNLGRDLREAGEYQGSVRLLTDVMDMYANVLGPDSRAAQNARANLAVSLRSAGRAHEAATLLDEAYGRLNELYGATSPDTLAARLSRSVSLLAVGDNARAEVELESVRRAYRETLGESHPHTLVCVSNLAAVARAMGDHARARRRAQAAVDGLASVLGPDHPYALAATTNLTVCMAEDGDLAQALELAAETGRRLVEILAEDHPDALRCQANEVLLRRASGLANDDEVTRALDSLGDRIGTEHTTTVALGQGRYLHRIIDPHPY